MHEVAHVLLGHRFRKQLDVVDDVTDRGTPLRRVNEPAKRMAAALMGMGDRQQIGVRREQDAAEVRRALEQVGIIRSRVCVPRTDNFEMP